MDAGNYKTEEYAANYKTEELGHRKLQTRGVRMQQTTVEATRHKFASQYTAPHKRDNFYKCFNLNLRKTAFAQ